ncbi:MAG TPA: hypothetical protein VEC16_03510 [Alphaproteobacteria bacterium]|nr:hypothetical protein [Alphaproteobacteria bacterium]
MKRDFMYVKLDFKDQSITIKPSKDSREGKDSVSAKKIHWFNGYYSNITDMLLQHSNLLHAMRKNFIIDGYNYSDLLMPILYQHDYFFQKSPGTLIIYNYIEILDSLNLKKGQTLTLEVEDFYENTFVKCAEIIAKEKGFKLHVIKNKTLSKKLSFIYENSFPMYLLLRGRLGLRHALGLVRRILGKSNSDSKEDVLFLANIRFLRKNFDDNLMFGSVMKNLKKKTTSKTLFYEEAIQSKNIKLLKKYAFMKGSYIGDYYTYTHFRNNDKDFKKLKNRWNELKNTTKFQASFKYNGYNYYELIRPRLELLFNALSYLSCDMKNIAARINEKENYKAIVIDHAENTLGKAFMIHNNLEKNANAKRKKRSVVALSHEQIYPGCLHTSTKNKIAMDRNSPAWRPLPDVSCQWSEYSKDVLVKYCAYPENVVKVTGSPKFDWIFNAHYDREKFVKKYSFFNDPRKKILIVSSNMLDHFNIYLDVARKNSEYLFVYKPHPNESLELVLNSFKNRPKNLIIVEPAADTYSLLNFSDYVLMFNTTAGFEAMLFGKIVLMIIYNDIEPDGIKFKDTGAVIEVADGSDVKDALHKLKNPVYEKHMKENIKHFVNRLHYGNDGKAASRVAKQIEKLL